LTFTEKVFTDEWAKKLSTNNNHSKEPVINNKQQEGLNFNQIKLLKTRRIIISGDFFN
jgi:hypothetical protein